MINNIINIDELNKKIEKEKKELIKKMKLFLKLKGISHTQLAGNGNHRSYVLQVDDSFVSVSYDDNSYKIKGLANASLSFGGYTRNNIHYGVSTCFISSVIVNFLETLQDEERWEERELN